MTELMQQLQQWANEGRYDWDNGTFEWDKMGNSDPRDLEPFDAFRFVDGWEPFVQCVLDGTIQVWRPVEHYKPKIGAYVIAIVDGMGLQGSIDDRGLFDDDARHCGVPFTHWQPEPETEGIV